MDEEDELEVVFWRLVGGEVAALLVPVVVSVSLLVDIFERGGLVVVFEFRTHLAKNYREERRFPGTWVALKGSRSTKNRSFLVYSFTNRPLLLHLHVRV